MLTFETAMELTRTVGSHASFEDEECRAYFDVLMSLAPKSLIVEVGLEYGRSSSIALQVAKERELRYLGIDPFVKVDDVRIPEPYPIWMAMAEEVGIRFRLAKMKSCDVDIDEPIGAILIDGDHDYAAVLEDCERFLPHVVNGGYAMFHDYQRDSLPDVTGAVNHYFLVTDDDGYQWRFIRTVGTLGIWRRI